MDTDRNLLFGVLALQADLLTSVQFAEACSAWAGRKDRPLADLLVERGWLTDADRADVERLLQRKLHKHAGDVRASLAEVTSDPVRQALSVVNDDAVRQSLGPATPVPLGHVLLSTTAFTPQAHGRYTLSRLHATGGIGQVWLARDGSLGRDVALKELRPERAADPRLWARFLREAQITGQLEHPGIVPIYELGSKPDGEAPFYTMRFVRGRTFGEAVRSYHERSRRGEAGLLEFRALLAAFVGVCQAVAFAHSRGVIHRDLKPQNVVLGDYGEVIVLDWGLAKVVGQPDESQAAAPMPDSVEQTQAGQVLGTPAYMAPEQADGRLDRLHARTDVYGLGTILYELLSGKSPFHAENTQDLLQKVRHEAPVRPRRIVATTPPALEAICLKAMAKQPDDRYAAAPAVAQEVQQWLADEPVSAYRDTVGVRATRWARRHRSLVTAAVVLLTAGVVALAAGTVLINRERVRAEEGFRQARAAVDEYFTTVSENKLLDVPGLQPLRKELLESALRYYQEFLNQRAGDRSVEAEVAAASYRVALLTNVIGSVEEARPAFQRAQDLYEGLVRDHPEVTKYRCDLAICCNDFGNLLLRAGQLDDAMRLHRRALALREELAAELPDNARVQNELTKSYANVGRVLLHQGQLAESLAMYEKARAINARLVEAGPGALDFPSDLGKRFNSVYSFRVDLAIHLESIGDLQSRSGQPATAIRTLQQARDLYQTLARDRPLDVDVSGRLAGCCITLGWLHIQARQPEEARAAFEQARTVLEPLAAANPWIPAVQSQLAASHNNLGELERDAGALTEALRHHRQALSIQERIVREHPGVPGYRIELAAMHAGLGRLHAKAGEKTEALQALEKAITIGEEAAGTSLLARYDLACHLALCIPLVGAETAAGRKLAERAMEALRRAVGDGFRRPGGFAADTDLDALRGRSDFARLMAEVEPKGSPERPQEK